MMKKPTKKPGAIGPAIAALVVGGPGKSKGSPSVAMTAEKRSAFMDLKSALDAGNPRLFYAALDAVMSHCGYGGDQKEEYDEGEM
jgi:hypothetical protein